MVATRREAPPTELGDREPAGRRSGRRARASIALGIFLVTFAVYAASSVRLQTDSHWVVFTARSVLRHGDVDLDEYGAQVREAHGFQLDRLDGREYYAVPLATSLAALPVVGIASLVDGASLDRALDRGESQPYDGLSAALIVALSCVVLYFALSRVYARPSVTVLTVAAYAFGTQAWSTASRTMWMHAPSMLAITIALYCAVRARENVTWFAPLGATLGVAYFVRPTNVVPLLVFAVFALTYGRRAISRYVLSAGAVGLIFLALDQALYGTSVQPYFRNSRLALSPTTIEAALGNLVSPSRGLFVFVPLSLVAAYGALVAHRNGSLDRLCRSALATIILYWVVVSLFPHWWGGYSYGPRFLSDVAPFIVWFLPPAFAAVSRRSGVHKRFLALAIVAVLIVASAAINARGAVAPSTSGWNWSPHDIDVAHWRLWDWSDPQFLR
jgi:hypothetical protein